MRLRPVLILLLLLPLHAHAVVSADERVEHYDISGGSAADLRREMNARGPQDARGKRADGYTRWSVRWNTRYQDSGSGCAIDLAATSVSTMITLPRWSNAGAGSAAARAQWDRYLAALNQHEQGHRRNGLDAANEIDRATSALPAAATCDALGAAVNASANRLLQKYQQRDLDYDRDTAHGTTQGARFP